MAAEATLVFKHPVEGVTVLELEFYRTLEAGGLAAVSTKGRRIILGPVVEYMIDEWADADELAQAADAGSVISA